MKNWRKLSEAFAATEGGVLDRIDDSFAVYFTLSVGGIISTDRGWDHVTVSHVSRTPTYQEMKFVKRLVFDDHEWAFEVHPPPSKYVSIHHNALHLWRPQNGVWGPPPVEILTDPSGTGMTF